MRVVREGRPGPFAPDDVTLLLHYTMDDVVDAFVSHLREKGHHPEVGDSSHAQGNSPDRVSPDYGGMVMTKWRRMSFDVDGVELSFYAHHFDQTMLSFNWALEYDHPTVGVIASHYFNYACSKDWVSKAKQVLIDNEAKVRAVERQELDDYEKAMSSLRDAPNLRVPEPTDPSKVN